MARIPWGLLLLILGLIAGKGRTVQAQNNQGSQAQSTAPQIARRQMNLMDFFLNSNQNTPVGDNTPGLVLATQPQSSQVQVQQPQPNQLMFVRESGFPSSSGGLVSRLIMARRMLRLQRLQNRLQVLPMLMGIRQIQVQQPLQQRLLQQPQQQQQQQQRQVTYLNNRAGPLYEDYNPSDSYGSKQKPRQQQQGNDGTYFGNNDLPNQQLKEFKQGGFGHQDDGQFSDFAHQNYNPEQFFDDAQENFKDSPKDDESIDLHSGYKNQGPAHKDVHIGGGAKPIVVHKPPVIHPPTSVHKPHVVQHQVHKPVVAPEPLVPLGILPKPLLNVNGRLFFGAEVGKGAGVVS